MSTTTIKFQCETITPLFMHGADGKTPELRPASIKGVMRFWWRAINGDKKNIEELREEEGEIFGNTEKKSKLIIFPIEIIEEKDYKISLTPHHREGYCSESDEEKNCFFKNDRCMKANKKIGKFYTFEIKMFLKNNSYINKEQLINLFQTVTILGGFGQRSRRGFGSIQIVEDEVFTSLEEIEELIKSINPKFSFGAKNKKENYPYIIDIQIGKNGEKDFNRLLKKIGVIF